MLQRNSVFLKEIGSYCNDLATITAQFSGVYYLVIGYRYIHKFYSIHGWMELNTVSAQIMPINRCSNVQFTRFR